MTLFSLGLKQLFVVFAPFAWLVRLFGRKGPAFILTVIFGLAVMLIREYRSSSPLVVEPLFLGLLVLRGAALALSVYLYLRGGVLLVWWWDLLLQSQGPADYPWSMTRRDDITANLRPAIKRNRNHLSGVRIAAQPPPGAS